MLTRSDLQMLRFSIKRNDPTPIEKRQEWADGIDEILASTNATDSLKRSARETRELIQERGWLPAPGADCLRPLQSPSEQQHFATVAGSHRP